MRVFALDDLDEDSPPMTMAEAFPKRDIEIRVRDEEFVVQCEGLRELYHYPDEKCVTIHFTETKFGHCNFFIKLPEEFARELAIELVQAMI